MPTNAEILDLAPGAGYLAANDARKSVLFNNNPRVNPLLPQWIYALYFVIKKIYDIDPNYPGMTTLCIYLWEMMGRYGIMAMGLSGGGGSVPSPTPGNPLFPIKITQDNFTDLAQPTLYPNTNLFGNTLMVFMNTINRYLEDDEWHVNVEGLFIDMPGFDPTQFDYLIQIDKVYNG